MTTRASIPKLWLIDKPGTSYKAGSKPPTSEEVFLHFRYLLLEEGNTGMPVLREKAEACCSFVIEWWKLTGIETIALSSMAEKILKMHKDYKNLHKQRAKETDAATKNRAAFLSMLSGTFWVTKKDQKLCEEDKQYLENMAEPTRVGSLGSVDTHTHRKKVNKALREHQEQQQQEREIQRQLEERAGTTEKGATNEDSEEPSINDPDFIKKRSLPRRSKYRKTVTLEFPASSKWMAAPMLIADKNQFSHRGSFEFVAEIFKAGGANLDDVALSKNTVQR